MSSNLIANNQINTSKFTYTKINQTNDTTSQTNNLLIPSVSEQSQIHDTRRLKDFKDQSFGGYNRGNVSTALDKSLLTDKTEASLHWCAQLLASGISNQLWEKLIVFAIKHINIYNPKLPEFILNRTMDWYSITDNPKFSKDAVLTLRNHSTIRLLLCEFVSIIVLAKKRKLNALPRVKKEEFVIDTFKSRLEAPNNAICESLFIDGDPSEIRIAINELAFQLHNSNSGKSLYWLNWIVEWEKINTKKYGKYECGQRNLEGVDAKYFKDVVWFLWAVINKINGIKNSSRSYMGSVSIADKQIQSLFKLYKYKFTPGSKTRKLNYVIMAILYLTEMIDWETPLIDRPNLLFQNLLGYDKIFAGMKSQQVTNTANNELMNIVVENNYMIPEKHKAYEEDMRRKAIERQRLEREHLAKQKKINIESLDKLTAVSKMDKILNGDVF
jgi:hypothetical protein